MSVLSAPSLRLAIHADRAQMGAAAAHEVQAEIARVVAQKGRARIVMACAPSQSDYYRALVELARQTPEVWRRVEVFHMDDYVGLSASHPQSFRYYLRRHFLDHVAVEAFNPLCGEAPDPHAEARRYGELLAAAPIDVISLGIGENGHIAFNDPPVADFDDPHLIKVVELDEACRNQQVNDGCFPTFNDVPKHAFTLTVSVFRRARRLSIHVPGPRKADAVKATLEGPIATTCPASILRLHPEATLHVDTASAQLLRS